MKQTFSWIWILTICTVLMSMVSLPVDAASATPELQISIKSSGNEVQLHISGSQFKDLYAYELKLTFDSERMKLIKSSSAMTGYTVPAVVKGSMISFAHTKTGPVDGNSGDLSIGDFVFQRTGSGAAQFTLNEATLVDSKLQSVKVIVNKSESVNGEVAVVKFTDISGHWAEQQILSAAELGFVSGYTNGMFKPNNNVTRAEFAAMLVRALKLPAPADTELGFKDAAEIAEWAKPYIGSAVEAKVISGYSDATFRPNRQISRAEMVAMIVRASEEALGDAGKTSFADDQDIAAWAKPYVNSAAAAGFIKGKGNNRFEPNAQATRAEAVTVLMNVLNKS